MTTQRPATLGELKRAGYRSRSLHEEVHANLVRKLAACEELFPGIIGYEDTVIPEIENALLAGQNIIFLGERGQAKSRIARAITSLLDEQIAVVAGSELNDDPCAPVSPSAIKTVQELGDRTPVAWLDREARYTEKLATPDVSMADLIGDVDPIKVAEGRYLADELTVHYGLVPRANRGIFCVNELPDLPERVQVALFNLMQERDLQIKGYRIRLPLDMIVLATANPEDYTNRGRIITPLKDRFGAQVRTHYPRTVKHEQAIIGQESSKPLASGIEFTCPAYMLDIVAEISAQARASHEINQRSGVSVRVSIANYETLRSAAVKRALRLGERTAAPRITDLQAIIPSMRGKIELESVEENREHAVIADLTNRAVAAVFGRLFQPSELDTLASLFEEGVAVTTGETRRAADYLPYLAGMKGLNSAVQRLKSATDAESAAAVEFVLEGMHLHRRLNRQKSGTRYEYVKPVQPTPDLAEGPRGGEGGQQRRRDRRRESGQPENN